MERNARWFYPIREGVESATKFGRAHQDGYEVFSYDKTGTPPIVNRCRAMVSKNMKASGRACVIFAAADARGA
jgi:hypothetical protein